MPVLEIYYPIVLSGVPISGINNPVLVASTSNESMRISIDVKKTNRYEQTGIIFDNIDKKIFSPSNWLTHKVEEFYTNLREVLGYDIRAVIRIRSHKPISDYLVYSLASYLVIKETSRLEGVSLSDEEIRRFLKELDDLVLKESYMEKTIIECYRLGLTSTGLHLCRSGEENFSIQPGLVLKILEIDVDRQLSCLLTNRDLEKLGDTSVLVIKLLGYIPVEVYRLAKKRGILDHIRKLLEMENVITRTLCGIPCSNKLNDTSYICKLMPWSHGLFTNTCIVVEGAVND